MLAKPVVIHDREAHAAILEHLADWSARVAGEGRLARPFGVMHCFSGDLAMARTSVELGFLISIAGPVTYPKADRLAEVVRELPLEALVIETDAPYLPPQPWRGRRNEPSYLPVTAEMVARLRGLSGETVAEATRENAGRLFRWPAPVGSAG
jgi:TatD DNase family protein